MYRISRIRDSQEAGFAAAEQKIQESSVRSAANQCLYHGPVVVEQSIPESFARNVGNRHRKHRGPAAVEQLIQENSAQSAGNREDKRKNGDSQYKMPQLWWRINF